MKNKPLPFLFLLLSFSTALYSQNKKSIPDIEKIYLHTDRDIYTIGESLWFKAYSIYAYTTTLYNKSNVLYVELISPNSKIIDRRKIRLEDGLAHGDFELKDSIGIKAGIYQLKAYTNWNRNFGKDFIFKKEIEIIDIFKNTNVAKNQVALKSNLGNNNINKKSQTSFSVQFFPEGGSLLQNVASIVAFKAIDINGKPIKIQGKILDSSGNLVSMIYSTHNGMGKFKLTPKSQTNYFAEITAINNDKIKIPLPNVKIEGYVLSMQKFKEKEIVTIKTNKATLLKKPNEALTIDCTLKGISYFNGTQPLHKTSLSFELPTKNFPTGIFQLTLYNADLQPQSERLKYIHKKNDLAIKIYTDKKSYKPKEKVSINLSSKNESDKPVVASYSLSSIDLNGLETKKDYTSNISSYFLMESDIRGKVYNPGYYFDTTNPKRFINIDLLLLTQGWRDFIWKKMPKVKDSIAYNAEKGIYVSGIVKSLFGNKIRENFDVNLALTSAKTGNTNILNTQTDSLGRFKFEDMIFTGDMMMMLNSKNEKGKNRGMIVLDSLNLPMHVNYKNTYFSNTQNTKTLREKIYNKYVNFGISPENTLAEIEIVATKKNTAPESLFGTADRTFITDEKTARFSSIFQLIQFSIPGITAIGGSISFNKFSDSPYILVDGVEWSPADIGAMQPDDVAKVEAFTGAGISMFGTRGANGVLIIYTKEGNVDANSKKVFHSITKKLEGFYKARVFYNSGLKNKNTDFEIDKTAAIKNTLYWNPYFHPDENGKAQANYLNSEVTTKVKVTLEGLTANGVPVVVKTFYTIEK